MQKRSVRYKVNNQGSFAVYVMEILGQEAGPA
jgi:hypothetical protein